MSYIPPFKETSLDWGCGNVLFIYPDDGVKRHRSLIEGRHIPDCCIMELEQMIAVQEGELVSGRS